MLRRNKCKWINMKPSIWLPLSDWTTFVWRLWLARKDRATHSSRSNIVGLWFSSRPRSGLFGWFSIGRYEKKCESFGLYAAKFESGAMRFWGKNRPGAGTLSKQGFIPCLSIINSNSFKFIQNRSESRFWGTLGSRGYCFRIDTDGDAKRRGEKNNLWSQE